MEKPWTWNKNDISLMDEQRMTRFHCNAAIFAYEVEHGLIVQSVNDGTICWSTNTRPRAHAAVALSDVKDGAQIVAFSHHNRVITHNLLTRQSLEALQTGGRSVSALAWSLEGNRLATGAVDGILQVWDLNDSQNPTSICSTRFDNVRILSWSKARSDALAIVDNHGLHVWSHTKIVHTTSVHDDSQSRLSHVIWSTAHPLVLLGAYDDGRLVSWDLEALYDGSTRLNATSTMQSDSQKRRFADIVSIDWLDEHKVGVLYNNGRYFAAVDIRSTRFGSVDWEMAFSHAYRAFLLVSDNGRESVRMVSPVKQRTYPLPGRRAELTDALDDFASDQSSVMPKTNSTSKVVPRAATMTAHPISSLKKHRNIRPGSRRDQHKKEDEEMSSNKDNAQDTVLVPPKLLRAESDSPMPFLSPAIPAKRPIKEHKLGFEEDLPLPSVNSTGYFGSFSSEAVNDSDSDDDTFGLRDAKNGRGIQGTVNLPPPRTCGAAFAANGTLVVYRPPKNKPITTKTTSVLEQIDAANSDREEATRLFPTFGNLLAMPAEVSQIVITSLGLDQISTSQEPWQPRSLSMIPQLAHQTSLQSMQVTVHILDVHSRQLAEQYRIFCRNDESGSALCLSNAAVAAMHNRTSDALLWQMLSKVIGDGQNSASCWSDHPLGHTWLIRKVYGLAEAEGNVQMLASVTAVLLGSVEKSHLTPLGHLAEHLAIKTSYDVQIDTPQKPPTTPSVPRLQTDLTASGVSHMSPITHRANSAISSRNPSLPTTPRLDSSSSTPPWNFASFTQSSKSAVGKSVSPENARGSFSAAVKSYAQSVSDKFAAYSTSPPLRKGGPSPNNELSTSLSSVAGSWTKSVSFASTTLTTRSSTLGRNSIDVDEDYESDRTIEDTIPTLRRQSIPVSLGVNWRNTEAFSDADFGTAQSTLIPKELLPHCQIWTRMWAEQLRHRQLHLLAVEFDKVSSALGQMQGMNVQVRSDEHSMATSSLAACSICECTIDGLEHVCADRQHACHITCLLQIIDHSAETYECPLGCGCQCAIDT